MATVQGENFSQIILSFFHSESVIFVGISCASQYFRLSNLHPQTQPGFQIVNSGHNVDVDAEEKQ